jgi:hypothetical protein
MARVLMGLFLAYLTIATPRLSADVDLAKVRQAEKISIALTGQPLNAALRAKVVKEQITLDALADQLSMSPEFIEYFAQYWTRVLGMQSPIDMYSQAGLSIGTNWNGVGPNDETRLNVDYLKRYLDARRTSSPEIVVAACPDGPLLVWNGANNMIPIFDKAANEGMSFTKPILDGTQSLWAELLTIAKDSYTTCTDTTTVQVKPWWDPEGVTIDSRYDSAASYRTTRKLLERCGPAMIKCTIGADRRYDRFIDEVDRDVSLEPAYIISHTVAENKPFASILTTQDTIMTGRYGYFLANQGQATLKNYPGQTLQDINHKIFTSPSAIDAKHYWIKRGSLHAGLLTTPAFQIITNGRRAKANRAFETFLCKKFTVPDGAQADPSDANPDLTKRAYCSYCHRTLEPMAAFFNKWPNVGTTAYIYNGSQMVDDTGRFNGLQGTGAAAFGKILSESEGFDECSIKRAFEFLNGRKMSYFEAENRLAPLVADFKASEKNLRLVIKAMVLSPEFLSPKGATP